MRMDTEWLEITRHTALDNSRTDSSSQILRIEKNDEKFAFSCLPYTASEIENALHHEELPPARRTVLCIYGAVRGVGGIDSWGTDVEEDYRISAETDKHRTYMRRSSMSLRTVIMTARLRRPALKMHQKPEIHWSLNCI